MFPFSQVLPSHVVGAISLVVLAVALIAYYGRHLSGAWRSIYIVTATFALYLNVFVGVVQAFQKVSFLRPLAPTQAEAPFVIAQLAVLVSVRRAGFSCGEEISIRTPTRRHRHRRPLLEHRTIAGRMTTARAILIAGPTASGKSGLAVALAERLGGTVINADSMQVYRDLRILTARPTARRRSPRAARALRFRQRRRSLFGRTLRGGCCQRHRATRERRGACPSSSAAPGSTSRCCWRDCRRFRLPIRWCGTSGGRRQECGRRPNCTPFSLRETPRPRRV